MIDNQVADQLISKSSGRLGQDERWYRVEAAGWDDTSACPAGEEIVFRDDGSC